MPSRGVLQLTVINQGDGPCGVGDHLSAALLHVGGATTRGDAPALGRVHPLPPCGEVGTFSHALTWLLDLDDDVDALSLILLVEGRGGEGSAWIEVAGPHLDWCPSDGRSRVDRVFREGHCGIRGCVERVERYGRPTLWRYAVVAGCETPATGLPTTRPLERQPTGGPMAATLASLAVDPWALPEQRLTA